MDGLRRGIIRILKGPTGGLLASLALAAFMGGVAIAAPGPSFGAGIDQADVSGAVEAASERNDVRIVGGRMPEAASSRGAPGASEVRPDHRPDDAAAAGSANRRTPPQANDPHAVR
jgi:hypothetical protein